MRTCGKVRNPGCVAIGLTCGFASANHGQDEIHRELRNLFAGIRVSGRSQWSEGPRLNARDPPESVLICNRESGGSLWKLTLRVFVSCWWDWATSRCSALRTKQPGPCGCISVGRVLRPDCVGCGGRLWSDGERPVELVDLPAFGRAARLVWHKRRWRCCARGCEVRTVTEQDCEIAPPREKLTTRAGRWATRQAGRGRPLGGIADELGCSWHPVNMSVRRWGEALLDADVERIAETEALGLDEHLMWRRGRFRTKAWATSGPSLKWLGGLGLGMPVVIAPPLEMSVEHREELEVMARSDSLPYRQVRQASALVMAADGVANGAIARAVGVKTDTVRAWRVRFAADGVTAVGRVRPGRGRKPEIPAEVVEAIVADTLGGRPAGGATHWSTRAMAARHGVGKDTVARLWRARELRRGGWRRSSCPTIRTSRPSSSMSSGCTWIPRSPRWCCAWTRSPSVRPWSGPSRRCR